jgi:homospermidine synthase
VIYKKFSNKILIVGFGSIGQAVLPLLFRHLKLTPDQVTILTANDYGNEVANHFKIDPKVLPLTKENYRSLLDQYLSPGDILLNLSVDVSSCALIEYCHKANALYLDTCIEPWAGGYFNSKLSIDERSNYALREQLLKLKPSYKGGPTALIAHGANPGLVSHFVKKALIQIAKDTKKFQATPANREEWATLARDLSIKVIHIAEQDTQSTPVIKEPKEFVNTWSVDGFISEGSQPSELGWGTHEKKLPKDGKQHKAGCRAAIYLERSGLSTRVRSWAPNAGPFLGYLVTHNEAISISNYLSLKNGNEVTYRPTVHYSYQPCADAILSIHEVIATNLQQPPTKRLLLKEITDGMDELGVLLLGHEKNGYWFGSQLTIQEARKLAPFNNATSLQVASGVLAGLIWIIENPQQGMVEPEDIDYERVLEIAAPYLSRLTGHYTDWTPLTGRNQLFPEEIDTHDHWQFKNFRVG